MELHIALDGGGDLAGRIYGALRDGIRDARIRPGDRLPPTRELARTLNVSRNTVAAAYERLAAEGFLVGRVGAGTFVADAFSDRRSGADSPTGGTRAALRPRPAWSGVADPPATGRGPIRFDFGVGVPDARLFPFDAWRRLVAAELRLTANDPGGYADPAGHAGLREAIARYVGYARSVRAGPEDVVVTNGMQQALDLIARVLVTPGDVVAVEEPGYPPARQVFAAAGARVEGVPVDAEGLVVERLPKGAKLVYTTPSHQFPLGTPMSLPRRAALLRWADRHGAAVIEDDYDTEFRFSERPLEPLHSLDSAGRVLYAGTFSKTLLPSLRIGYVVVPSTIRGALRAAKRITDGQSPVVFQAALARFMAEGRLARHIRKALKVYAARRAAVVDALSGDLAEHLEPVPSAAGLHVCARLRSGDVAAAAAVVNGARERGIVVESLAAYCQEGAEQAGLVIGYGTIEPDPARAGLTELATLLSQSDVPQR